MTLRETGRAVWCSSNEQPLDKTNNPIRCKEVWVAYRWLQPVLPYKEVSE